MGDNPNPFDYIEPNDEQKTKLNAMREAFKELHEKVVVLPGGRYKAMAISKLEEAAMLVNKAITHEPLGAPR